MNQYKEYWPKPSSYHLDTGKIKRLMNERRLSEEDIAARVKTSQPTIHRTITNKTRNERMQRAIARALNMSLNALIMPEAQPQPDQPAA